MGKAKGNKIYNCKTVAVRYRFLFEISGRGELLVKFLPHPVIALKVGPPKKKYYDVFIPKNVEYEDDIEYLKSLDPKEWKSQDHYKVLGIPRLRYWATDEIIKRAYREKVLKYHPDKKQKISEGHFYTCITMAHETLKDKSRRRAYDSVDPQFDNNLPSVSDIRKDFYSTLNYYFGLNSRWSEKPRVPRLGDADSTREEVDEFYSFWYDFKSWREYSYECVEDKDKCQDRDERRHIHKMNKAEQLRKKKEEMLRIRRLVDLAYNNDPRIAKFKKDEKDRKSAAKRAKQIAEQIKKEEEERVLREAVLAKEQAEAAEKAMLKAKRQEREAQKKALKKERKILRTICKENDYFAENSEQNLAHVTGVESICEKLSLIELGKLNQYLKNNGKTVFLKVLEGDKAYLEEELLSVLDSAKEKTTFVNQSTTVMVVPEWTENQHSTFPGNSTKLSNLKKVDNKQTYDDFKNDKENIPHIENGDTPKSTASLKTSTKRQTGLPRTASEQQSLLAEAKDLQTTDGSGISKNMDSLTLNGADRKPKASVKESSSNSDIEPKTAVPWTEIEQQLLEQALKKYPTSTAERWNRIAECIPFRTKKECMNRYKKLVKATKPAQVAVTK